MSMFSDPQKNIEQCGIQVGMEIADFGSGSGFYTISVAKALISTGKVYAIDVQKDLLSKLKNSAVNDGLYNVETIWGDIEKINGTHLRDMSVDFVLICNALFQIKDKSITINEAKRVLKPGGKVLIVDWSDSFGGVGPKQENIVKKDFVVDIMERSGFHMEREISAGANHYGLIFKKL